MFILEAVFDNLCKMYSVISIILSLLSSVMKRGFAKTPTNQVVYDKLSHYFISISKIEFGHESFVFSLFSFLN